MYKTKNISGWGKYPIQKEACIYSLNEKSDELITPRGNGRSYGDAAIGKNILSCLSLKKEMSLNKEKAVLTCDSGFLLRDVLNYVIPLGYTIATIPGTQFVSIGGMVAADVHGKNHFNSGSLGNWIIELLIQTKNNEQLWCSLTSNVDLFKTTISGMGLTGIILKIRIQLVPIKSCNYIQKTTSLNSIESLINTFNKCSNTFQVAWLDLLNNDFKCLLFSAHESNQNNILSFQLKKPILNIPKLDLRVISKLLMKRYNKRYYSVNSKLIENTLYFDDFFFPLDKYNNWSRLYGKKGMIQYQFILPSENVIKGFKKIISLINNSEHKPYLSVLKKYKKNTSPGLLSFPLEGYSLAMDFPVKNGLIDFLNTLDIIVVQFEGRIYLAKDACLQANNIHEMYPNIELFKNNIANCNYSSNLANRLNLK